MENNFEYRDIFDEGGIRVVKTERGTYRWIIDSETEFRSPFDAFKDAMVVIGQPTKETMISEEIDLPWPKVVVKTDIGLLG